MRRYGKIGAAERNRDLVLKLVEDGWFLKDIAKRIGTNHHRVKNFLVRIGVNKDFVAARRGAKGANWRGGRRIDNDGYVLVYAPEHPRNRCGAVLEHRLVMEKILGRYLLPHEVVHHKDKNKQNNDPSNLELFSENSRHLKHERTGLVPRWTEDGLRRMREAVLRSAAIRRGKTMTQIKLDAALKRQNSVRPPMSPQTVPQSPSGMEPPPR